MTERLGFEDLFDKNLKKEIDALQRSFEDLADTQAKFVDQAKKNNQEAAKSERDRVKAASTANSQNEAIFDDAIKRTDELTKEQRQLIEAQKEAIRINKDTGDSIAALRAEQKRLRIELEQVDRSTEAGEKRFNSLQQELAQTVGAVSKVSKETRELAKTTDLAENSYADLSKQLNDARKRLRALPNAIDKSTLSWDQNNKEVAETVREINKLDKALKGADKALGQSQRNVGNYADSIKEALPDIGGLGGGLGNIGSLLSKAGPIGAGAVAVGAAFAAAFSHASELAKVILPQLNSVRLVLGDTETDIVGLTAAFRATAEFFDKDFNEILRATNALTENLGVSAAEGLDLINSALIQGIDVQGDLLDQISEYSVQLGAAGVNAETLFAIVTQSAEKGLFSDKALDTIKEGGLRIRENTKATQEALVPLGAFRNEQIALAVESGDTFGALQLVSEGMNEVELSAMQTQTIIADVFGGPGEDVGIDFLLNLKDINTTFATTEDIINDTTGRFTAFQKAQAKSLIVQQEFEESQVAVAQAFGGIGKSLSNIGTQFKTFFNNILADGILRIRLLAAEFTGFFTGIRDFLTGDIGFSGIAERVRSERAKVFQELSLQREQAAQEEQDQANKQAAALAEIDQKANDEKLKRLAKSLFELDQFRLEKQVELNKAIAENDENLFGDRLKAAEIAGMKQIEAQQKILAELLSNEELNFADRELILLKHADRIIDIEEDTAKQIQKIRADAQKVIVVEQQGLNVETEKNRGIDFKNALALRDRIVKADEEKLAKDKEREATREQIVSAGFDAGSQALNAALDIRANALQAAFDIELANLEARQEAELESAGNNEVAKAAINAKFEEQRKQLAADRARQEKQTAIFGAIINTALAITKALSTLPAPASFIAAGIAAAQGAIQVATIAATPLPSFEKGTADAPGGLSWVGEGGKELVLDGKKMILTPAEPSIMNIPAHAQVLTAQETKAALDHMETPEVLKDTDQLDHLTELISARERDLLNAIDNQRNYQFNMTRKGITMFLSTKNKKTEMLNHRYR